MSGGAEGGGTYERGRGIGRLTITTRPNSKGPHTQLAKDLSTPEANKAIEGVS